MKISWMRSEHWKEVKRIYQQGIDTGNATFEISSPASWGAWSRKFLSDLSLVLLDEDQVLGWAAISPVSSRQVYQGVGELSLYVDDGYQGQGIGKKLMEKIISRSEGAGFWTLQAGIFPENKPSIQIHLKAGFRIVGERVRIGRMASGPRVGEWRNVLLLEKRSETIG